MTNEIYHVLAGKIQGKDVYISGEGRFYVSFGREEDNDKVYGETWEELEQRIEKRLREEAAANMVDLDMPVLVAQGGTGTFKNPDRYRIKGIHGGHKKVTFHDQPGQFRSVFYPDTPEALELIQEYGRTEEAYNAARNRLAAIALRGDRANYSRIVPLTQMVDKLKQEYETAVRAARSLADARS